MNKKNILYLLGNKFFIASLLSFIPFTLQILAEYWVHFEEKKKTNAINARPYGQSMLLDLLLPKRECGWHTSGVSNFNE